MLPIANSENGDLQKKQIPQPDAIEILENLQKQAKLLDSVSNSRLINCKYDFLNEYLIQLKPSIGFDLSELKILGQGHEQFSGALSKLSQVSKTLLQKLNMHGFFVNETNNNAEKESPGFRISITNQIKNFQVVEILCQLGPYSKRYTVLNQFSNSFRNSYSLLGLGTFGEVFLSRDDTQHFAIKCLKFDLSDSGFLRNCIQEFFIADILSAIEVGPKLLRTKGFDFILFEDCMEFEMEVCRSVRKENLETDLKESLLKMHQLKVIHSDIKPANVMYSTSYEKNVFLDFGIAEVVNQEIWESTLTKFKGTYEFCGEEMKKLFVKKTQEHLNLYMNDIQMLIKTLKNVKQNLSQNVNHNYQKQQDSDHETKNHDQNLIIQLKYYMYMYDRTINLDEGSNVLIKKINCTKQLQAKQRSIEAMFAFCSNLNDFVLKDLRSKIVSQNLQMDLKMIFDDQKNEANDIKDMELGLNSKRNRRQENICKLQAYKNVSSLQIQKPSLKNLEFILFNQNQILGSFEPQDYFKLILSYVSFTRITYKVSLDRKEQVCDVFHEIILKLLNKKEVSASQFEYLHKQYQPQLDFVKQKCNNITFFFGFLLSYCMKNPINEFKFQALPWIFKQCIFLNFNYNLFFQQCIEKYYLELIKNHRDVLITKTLVETTEIIYMADEHFVVSSAPLKSYQKCELRYKLRKILRQTIKKIGLGLDQKPKYENEQERPLYLFYFVWTLFSLEDCYRIFVLDFITKLTKYIQEEFIKKGNAGEAQNFEKASRYVSFQAYKCFGNSCIHSENLNTFAFKKQFPLLFPDSISMYRKFDQTNIMEFILKIKSVQKRITQVYNLVEQFDQLHDAKPITFYFFFNRRFHEAFIQNDFTTIILLFDTLIQSDSNVIRNFNIFSRFMSNWYSYSTLQRKHSHFKLFWAERSRAKNFRLVSILEKNYEERLNKNSQKHELTVDLELFGYKEIEKFTNDFQQLRLNISSQIHLQLNEMLEADNYKIKNCIRFFEPLCLDLHDVTISPEFNVLLKLYNPNQISLHQLLVIVKLFDISPRYSYLLFRKNVYKLILETLHHIMIDEQFSKIKTNDLQEFFINQMFTPSQLVKTLYFKPQDEQINYQRQTTQQKRFHKRIIYPVRDYLLTIVNTIQLNLESLQIDHYYKNKYFWQGMKLKRIQFPQKKLSSIFYHFFFFLIQEYHYFESFQIIVEFLLECILQKINNFEINYFDILKYSIDWLNNKKNFPSFEYSLRFIEFLRGEKKLHTNPRMRVVLFFATSIILYFQNLYQHHFKLWEQILLQTYKLYSHFLALPNPIIKSNRHNQIKFYVGQQISAFTLKYLAPLKKQRKYRIHLRKYIKKLFLIQKAYSQQIYNYGKEFAFKFIKIPKYFAFDLASIKNTQLMKKKCKSILINMYIQDIQKDCSILNYPVNKDNIYDYMFDEKVLKHIQINKFYPAKQIEWNFCKKFQIQDFYLYLYFYSNLSSQNLSGRFYSAPYLSHPKYQDIFKSDDKTILENIERMKLTRQYQISQETQQIMNLIFQLEVRFYAKQIYKMHRLKPNQISWINYC